MLKRLAGVAVVAAMVASMFSFHPSQGLARVPAKRKLLYLVCVGRSSHRSLPDCLDEAGASSGLREVYASGVTD